MDGTIDEMLAQARELAAELDTQPLYPPAICLARSGDLVPTVEGRDDTVKPSWRHKMRLGPRGKFDSRG